MVANRALTLASAILVVAGSFMAASAPAIAQSPIKAPFTASNNKWAKEDPTPSPSSSELSEADKQAAEKTREAAKKASEKTREAAKQAAEKTREASKQSKSKPEKTAGQLQLPPLIIRPAQPGESVEAETDSVDSSGSTNDASNGAGDSSATPTPSNASNVLTSGAGTGSKKLYKKSTTATSTNVQSSNQTADAAGVGSGAATDAGTGQSADNSQTQVTYVVSPPSENTGEANSNSQASSVKFADPTANDPIRLVSAATLKTPADQFFEIAGFCVLALAGGVAALVGWGVYRGIRFRRSEAFDFEYRS